MPDDISAVAHDTEVEPAQSADQDDHRLEELTAELAKWQERVPKLASALKLRTTQVNELETQLAKLQEGASSGDQAGAGVRARDELIAELEAKQQSLNERNRQSESELHARALELEELKEEAATWRQKWQTMATDLDAQAAQTEQAHAQSEEQRRTAEAEIHALRGVVTEHEQTLQSRQQDLQALEEQVQSLESRNEKLFETTELANTQIEALGDSLASQKNQLGEREAALVELGEAHDQLTRREADQQRELESLRQELTDAKSASEQQQVDHADRLGLAQSEIQSLKELVADQVRQLEQLDQDKHRLAQELKATELAMTGELDAAVAARQALESEHVQALSLQRQALESRYAQECLAQEATFEQALGEAEIAADRRSQQLSAQHDQWQAEFQAQQAVELAHMQLAAESDVQRLEAQCDAIARERDQDLIRQEQQHRARVAELAATTIAAEQDLQQQLTAAQHLLEAETVNLREAAAAERSQLQVQLHEQQQQYEQGRSDLEQQHSAALAALAATALASEQGLQSELSAMQIQFEAEAARDRSANIEHQLELVNQISEQQQQLDRQRGDVVHLQEELQAVVESLAAAQQDLQLQQQETGLARSHFTQAQDDASAVRAQLTAQLVAAQEMAAQQAEQQQRIDALTSELEATRAERELIMEAAEAANRDAQDNSGQVQALQGQLTQLQQTMASTDEDFSALSVERDQLQGRLLAAEAAQESQSGKLRVELDEGSRQLAERDAQLTQLQAELGELRQQRNALAADQEQQQAALSTAESNQQALQAQLDELLQDAERSKGRIGELELENADVQSTLAHAEAHSREQASQQEQLGNKVRELEQQLRDSELVEQTAQTLQQQLAERDAQVSELNAKLGELQEQRKALAADQAQTESALNTSEANQQALQAQHDELLQEIADLRETQAQQATTDAEQLQQRIAIKALEAQVAELEEVRSERDSYITTVLTLEDELQGLRLAVAEPAAAAAPAPTNGVNTAEHVAEIRRLEELIRERTEEANQLRWQLNLKEDGQRGADATPVVAAADDKMLLVLNQQLQMAQQENQRLAAEVRRLSERSVEDAEAASEAPSGRSVVVPLMAGTKIDDLTQIKGIGDKLAAQLAELGITTFAQIADLEVSAIDHEQHPLHGHRSRILRDDWVSQAAALR